MLNQRRLDDADDSRFRAVAILEDRHRRRFDVLQHDHLSASARKTERARCTCSHRVSERASELDEAIAGRSGGLTDELDELFAALGLDIRHCRLPWVASVGGATGSRSWP